MKTSLVFFGNERIATGVTTTAPILCGILEAGYSVEAIIVNHEKATSRKNRVLEIEEIAMSHNIPIYSPDSSASLLELCKTFKKSELAVLVAYGRIIPESVINEFPIGIINVHPSLLPKHRGSVPLESVILQGEQVTGVSIMQLVRAMDAGPVYAQSNHPMSGTETKQQLADDLSEEASMMLPKILSDILDRSLTPAEQDESLATYDQRILKSDGVIDWYKAASTIEREVRAYAGWPKSSTKLGPIDVTITAAHFVPTNSAQEPGSIEIQNDIGALMVECAEGRLCIDKLIPSGKKEMTAAEFIRGYGSRLKGTR